MIEQTYTYNIALQEDTTTEGVSRYPITWTLTSSSTCISFSSATGTLEEAGQIEFTVTAQDENCLNTTVTLNLVDNIGCSNAQNVALINPCDLTLSDISNADELDFVVTASAGTPPYQYKWNYDTSLFTTDSDESPVLSLNVIDGEAANRTNISVTVTDANGCEQTKSYNQQLCPITVEGAFITTYCVSVIKDSAKAINSNVTLPITSTCDIDYDTFEYTSTNSGITILHNGNGVFTVNVADGTSAGTFIIQYTVKNEYGSVSPVGSLFITVPSCSEVNTGGDVIAGEIIEAELNSGNTIGEIIELDVESNVYTNSEVDWSTFAITQAPVYGTAALSPTRKIEYTITNLTGTDSDQVGFELKTTQGTSLRKTYYINRNVIAAPVANNITVCATCDNPTSAIDITANDTGNIDKSSIQILTTSPFVDVSRDSNDDFIFTPNSSATFTNIITYRVANTQGTYSNTANIIVSSACAGEPVRTDITCTSKIFDLRDLFPNTNAFTSNFTEVTSGYTGQGGTIVGATGTVDFSAITAGTYTFRQTATNAGACAGTDDTADIDIILQEIPALSITSSSIISTDIGQVNFSATNIPLGSITILNNGGRPVYTSSPTLTGGTGTFNLQLATGANAITLQANTICGNTLLATVTINN